MANWSRFPFGQIALGYGLAGTRTAYALDSAFVLDGGTGSTGTGKCVGIRFCAQTTGTIDDILFLVEAAPAGAHDLSVNVCAQTGITRPGAAVANGTVTISGGTTATKWIKATFSSKPTVTAGTFYWIVIGDPEGAASNYSVLSRGSAPMSLNYPPSGAVILPLYPYTSSDGFRTNGSSAGQGAILCIHFTDGTYMGQPYSLAAADSSAAVERGWKITPTEDMVISGVAFNGLPTSGTLKIYANGNNPGGTTLYSVALNASVIANYLINFPPYTLIGGSAYRVVIDPGSATSNPGTLAIEDDTTHTAILEACGFPGSAAMCFTYESAGAWADDNSKMPRHMLLFNDNPAQAGGGGASMPGTMRGMAGMIK